MLNTSHGQNMTPSLLNICNTYEAWQALRYIILLQSSNTDHFRYLSSARRGPRSSRYGGHSKKEVGEPPGELYSSASEKIVSVDGRLRWFVVYR